jgi:hypothetical protein
MRGMEKGSIMLVVGVSLILVIIALMGVGGNEVMVLDSRGITRVTVRWIEQSVLLRLLLLEVEGGTLESERGIPVMGIIRRVEVVPRAEQRHELQVLLSRRGLSVKTATQTGQPREGAMTNPLPKKKLVVVPDLNHEDLHGTRAEITAVEVAAAVVNQLEMMIVRDLVNERGKIPIPKSHPPITTTLALIEDHVILTTRQ